MGFGAYIFVVVMAAAVMASAVYALYWAVKTGQFREFEKGATEIFDDEEPQGRPTDFFPKKKGRANRPGEPRLGGPFDKLRVPSPSREDASPYQGKPTA